MTSIFEALRADHDKQRTLVDLLARTEGDSDGRNELFARTCQALRTHAAAEERFFYRPLMDHDTTQEKARHSVAEHKEIDDILGHLTQTDTGSAGWLPAARKLRHLVVHHLDEEEHEVFQQAGKVLGDADKERLATAYRDDMDRRAEEA